MTTTLITGANKGLGLETARQLVAAGHTVWLGSRDKARGERAVAEVGGRLVELDVTDDASVAAAVETVGSLDVLINNAGIMDYPWTPVEDVTPDLIHRIYETNVVGLVRTTHAFLPLLAESANPVVVNVGSSLGSMGRVSTPGLPENELTAMAYGASKAAVNMITVHYAKSFPGFRVNCVVPGYVATDLNQHSGPLSVSEGAVIIVQMACLGPDGPTGTYCDVDGMLPW
ncbi:SDR family NAD(P)-dependent oxidoreductase [Kribbella sp. NPDC004536]|uniref:SDR family NAD(P)-dependent oxidoreductase n=1 Tax=Kribbella sp. NPDC004536 TaxID=3364106 RepID=UPI0036A78488